MKNLFLMALLSLMIISCREQEQGPITILTRDFSSQYPGWKPSKDTIVKNFNISFDNIIIPARITWVTAIDSTDCAQIYYVKFDRMDSSSNIKFSEFSPHILSCRTYMGENKRFSPFIIKGRIIVHKGIRIHELTGVICEINGLGEFFLLK